MNIVETEREDKNYIIKKNEKKIMLFEEVINSLTTYNMYKDILSKYKKTMSKDYYEKYRTEITLADKSKKLLEQYKVPLDADKSKIEDKINEIKLVIDNDRREAEDLKKELRDMKDIKLLLEELTNKKNKDKNIER